MRFRSASPEPAFAPELEPVVEAVEQQIATVGARIFTRAREDLPQLRTLDAALARAFRRSVEANVRVSLSRLGAGLGSPTEAPADGERLAQLWARAGLPLDALVRTLPIAHETLWGFLADAIEDADLPSDVQRQLSRGVSQFLFAYTDRLGLHITQAYDLERRSRPAGREQRALAAVKRVLAGDDEAAAALNYELDMVHVAFIAWGPAAGDAPGLLEPLLERRLLSAAIDEELHWGWLGGRQALGSREARALSRLVPASDFSLAFGRPATGGDGFRATHRQAARAQDIGARLGRAVTQHADIALEALAGASRDEVRAFVRDELGDLRCADARSARLRETLVAYFAAGGNKSAAAAALGIHEQTVTYRLRSVEDQLGAPIRARRAELETALRMRPLVD
jgi:hypothetical protein